MKSHLLKHTLLLLAAATAVSSSGQGGWKNGSEATGEVDPNVTTGCGYWANNVQNEDTCEMIEDSFGITQAQFEYWNPGLKTSSECKMVPGFSYCVSGPAGSASSAAPSVTPAKTITYNGTDAPVQTAVTNGCTQYHQVENGDTCHSIQDRYMSFTLAQFYSWNPAITECEGLIKGDYVCVGAVSPSIQPSSSSAFPTQTGVTQMCNKWHYVSDNDTCASIFSEFGLTAAQFYSWNPATGSNCNSLWLKTEVCVGISESTPSTTTSTPTETGTGTGSVPSPVQSGIASDCRKYYKVQSGDTCDKVETDNNISAANFLMWNPAVGSDCKDLELDVYVCVAAVPSPVQSGISSDCSKYYKVQSGDTCDKVETDNNISAANFLTWNPAVGSDCKDLELNVYVCVAV
ncbi:hypothetical protein N7499_010712 [Penicillium canescens]|nr:hypothetical protein N7499_010712 [Penicillium canescens]KAJ6183119.1 hypothetical protein N7485_001761 [Penicillium canescens]